MTEQSASPAPVKERSSQAARRAQARRVQLPPAISVHALADHLEVSPIEVIKQLMRGGIMANINQVIDFDTAASVCQSFGIHAVREAEQKTKLPTSGVAVEEDASKLILRPPVVTILGHVDHGKTSLLDAIRKTNVVATEAGGITQRIGAYQAEYNDHRITFLDTPGHEAFTAMRARGARVTDIAVLVVAANDGVMPQTVEAMNHAKAAGVPIVVAINKIDVPGADVERVQRQLSEHGLLIEAWGGDIIAVPVSAKSGEGIKELLESILVVAEVAELKANPERPAVGTVIETRLDKSRGPLATVLVQTGTLRVGDSVVVGVVRGRVKAMLTETGRRLKAATPSTPAELLGLTALPQAGDRLEVIADERAARQTVEERARQAETTRARGTSLEDVYARLTAGEVKELALILKADVQGSVEAVVNALQHLATEKLQTKVIHAASGTITESDVLLAVASQAIIIGFNTGIEPGARRLADSEGVDIRVYDVIYRLTEDVHAALTGLIEPTYQEVVEGRAEVRAVFSLGRKGTVAGCYVTEGHFTRSSQVRVLRGGKAVFDGAVASLRRFKDDVREVATGYECGLGLEGFSDVQEGDILEAHRTQQVGKPS
ncbi:MAG: translation initiation factor IF-2 [Chloroflexi bacterium]|nr:translation initiation factor IF-2 [Chloroflexota bacterium]